MFSFSFHLSAQIENADFLMRFRLSLTLKRPRSLMETTQYDAFSPESVFTYQHRTGAFSKRCVFKTMRFQRTALLKPFSKTSAFITVSVRTLVCVLKQKIIGVVKALITHHDYHHYYHCHQQCLSYAASHKFNLTPSFSVSCIGDIFGQAIFWRAM